MKPFKPFSRDSAGGVSSLFYCANLLTGVGDIFIDCCFTKLFTKMTSDMKTNGTFSYVQNITGWTARPEVHTREHPEIQSRNLRLAAVSHEIKKGEKWHEFKDMEVKKPTVVEVDVKKLKTLWAID